MCYLLSNALPESAFYKVNLLSYWIKGHIYILPSGFLSCCQHYFFHLIFLLELRLELGNFLGRILFRWDLEMNYPHPFLWLSHILHALTFCWTLFWYLGISDLLYRINLIIYFLAVYSLFFAYVSFYLFWTLKSFSDRLDSLNVLWHMNKIGRIYCWSLKININSSYQEF